MYCEYGCGNEAKFTNKSGKNTCEKYSAQCPALKEKNKDGLKKAYKTGKRLYVDHFGDKRAWSRGKNALMDSRVSRNGLMTEDVIFCEKSTSTRTYVRKLLMDEGRGNICEICKITNWLEQPISMQLDHINGVSNDNRRENLRFICPNCHSQTETYCGRNVNKRKSDERETPIKEWVEALKSEKNVYRALLKMNLCVSKKNYEKAIKIKEEYNI